MNYIGSKLKLSDWIKEEIHNTVGQDLSNKVFCDLFAGTGIVGRTFKTSVKALLPMILKHIAIILNKNYIENHRNLDRATDLIYELNTTPLIEGFVYQNYCIGSGSQRQYFSDYNGKN